ncbi:hypothetical protein H4R35_002353 [Dimargaris xerosporica]|nr:hypothetical protein H4R35_002353 [Dimargaris xerosporica]
MPLGLLDAREWVPALAIVLVLWLLGLILWSVTPHQGVRQIPHVPIHHTLLSAIRGESHAHFYQYHIKQRLEKYGMVRVYFTGRWLVYVSDPQYIYDFFYNPDTFDRPNPSSLLTGSPLRYFFGNGILAANGKNWRRQRRIAAPAFRKSLTPWVTVMCTRRFMQMLDQHLSEPIDIFSQLKRLTLEILGIEIFGIDFEVLNNAQSYFFTLYNEIIREVLNPIYLVLPIVNKLPWGPRLRTMAKIDELEKLLADTITQKRLNPAVHTGEDIVSILFRAMQDRRERLTSTELRVRTNLSLCAHS